MMINSYYYALKQKQFRWDSNCLIDPFSNIKDIFNLLIEKVFSQIHLTLNELYTNNRIGLIIGSSLAELNTDLAFSSINTNSESNIYSPGYLLRILQKTYGINGLAYALSNTCVTGIDALTIANSLLTDNQIDKCLLFLYDYAGPFVKAGFESYNILSSEKVIQPFNREKKGIVLQEGSAVVILLNKETSISYMKNTCVILSTCLINDAYAVTSFSNDFNGIKRAILSSLKEADLKIDDITAIFCSTNGVFENDIKYLKALNDLNYHNIITSIKHEINHTLGVSSVIEMLISFEIIVQGCFDSICHGYKLTDSIVEKYRIDGIYQQGIFMVIGTGFSGVTGSIIYKID